MEEHNIAKQVNAQVSWAKVQCHAQRAEEYPFTVNLLPLTVS